MVTRVALLALAVLASSTGCTSVRSVMLNRNECNTGWAKERHLPGVLMSCVYSNTRWLYMRSLPTSPRAWRGGRSKMCARLCKD